MTLLRVLVVDDSPLNRDRIVAILARSSFASVAACAADGAEALARLQETEPDVVLLDLEMPRMDGYGFLRVVMGSRPLPVIVVSGYSRKENVFRALELGALDFVAKGPFGIDAECERALLEKLELIRSVKRPGRPVLGPLPTPPRVEAIATASEQRPRAVVVFAASTGGPSTLSSILPRLPPPTDYALLIAQHMPARFTATFAQRLDRLSHFAVREPSDGELLTAGVAFVCPGDRCMELVRDARSDLRVRLRPPEADEAYVPNASKLFTSVAAAMSRRALSVVLTGMGDDGAQGALAVARAGGCVLVESEETAIVAGMPRAASRAAPEAMAVPATRMPEEIARVLRRISQ